jgi:hypothetical protein
VRPTLKSVAATVFYGGMFFSVRDPLFASVAGRPLFLGLAAILSLALMLWPGRTLRAVAYAICMGALATRAIGFVVDSDDWHVRVTACLLYGYIALLTTELVKLRTQLWGPTGRPDVPR